MVCAVTRNTDELADVALHSGGKRAWRALLHNVLTYCLGRPQLTADLPWLGVRMRVGSEDVHGRRLFKTGVHEPGLTRFFMRYLKTAPQDVVIDLGANVGYYSLLFARRCPAGATIHVIEAEPYNFELLTGNLARNGASAVQAHHVAISSENGSADLFLFKAGNRGKHSLVPMEGAERIAVRTVTFDSWWRNRALGDRVPTLLKMDVEGGEHGAMLGGREVFGRSRLVVMELNRKFLQRAGVTFDAHLDLIEEFGFALHTIDGDGRLTPIARADVSGDRSLNLVLASTEARAADWWPELQRG